MSEEKKESQHLSLSEGTVFCRKTGKNEQTKDEDGGLVYCGGCGLFLWKVR